jgi:hypothetical protein
MKVAYLGHCYFPLFLDNDTKKPAADNTIQNFILQEGNYQIPIYCQKPPIRPPFTFDILRKQEKIPTASLLIRVRKATTTEGYKVLSTRDVPQDEWETTGLVEASPEYAESIYNTSYCDVNNAEIVMFKDRAKRYDPQLVDTLKYLQESLNLPSPAVSNTIINLL